MEDMKWKYLISQTDLSGGVGAEGFLNDHGELGWEVIAIVPRKEGSIDGLNLPWYVVFKRPLEEN